MSLINQMLKDLESSRRGETARAELPRTIWLMDGIPTESRSRLLHVSAFAGIAVIAFGGWLYLRHEVSQGADSVQEVAVVPSNPLTAAPIAAVATPVREPGVGAAPGPMAGASTQPIVIPERPPQREPVAIAPKTVINETSLAPEQPQRKPASLVSTKIMAKAPSRRPRWASGAMEPVESEETSEQIYRKGARHYASGQIARAQDELERSIRLDSTNRDARLLLAKSYAASGDLERAADLLAEDPKAEADVEAAKLRAQFLLKKGHMTQAEKVLESSLTDVGDDPEVLGLLGALRQRQGRHAEAVDLYEKAVHDEPDQSKWSLGLAISLEAGKRYEEALGAYRRVMAVGGLSPEVRSYVEARIIALGDNR